MISIENLEKSFGDKLIFKNLDCLIEDGHFVGIYGASGIGKSTLAKILCGVLRPDAGRILFDGKLLYSADSKYDRTTGIQIQMVYQQPYSTLDPNQKIYDGFVELIKYHNFASDKAETAELIERIMTEVNLETSILNHLPHQISGGEAQRVSIAKCLLFNPKLLILDEATSMLDVSTQANVISMVKRSMAKNNGSVMLISHDNELVNAICDDIYLFENRGLRKIGENIQAGW